MPALRKNQRLPATPSKKSVAEARLQTGTDDLSDRNGNVNNFDNSEPPSEAESGGDSEFDDPEYIPNGDVSASLHTKGDSATVSKKGGKLSALPAVIDEVIFAMHAGAKEIDRRGGLLSPTKEIIYSDEWTLREKRRLLYALRSYGSRSLPRVQTCVRTKSLEQVVAFLTRLQDESLVKDCNRQMKVPGPSNLRRSTISRQVAPPVANVQDWLTVARRLNQRRTNFSLVTADVLDNIGISLIDAPTGVQKFNVKGKRQVLHFSRIYGALACMLRGKPVPPLTDLEYAVLIHLTSDLASGLKATDEQLVCLDKFLHKLECVGYEAFSSRELISLDALKNVGVVPDGNSTSSSSSKHMVDMTSLNPLMIPVELLDIPVGET